MKFNISMGELINEIAETIENKNLNFNYSNNVITPKYKDVIDLAVLTLYNQVVTNNNFENLIFKPNELAEIENPNTTVDYDIANVLNITVGREF